MIQEFIERENQIFEKLNEFKEIDLDFVLVGGYAVSAFNHRFSVDADIVIREQDKEKCKDVLVNNGFEEKQRKDLDSVYDGEFIGFTKGKDLPVNFDLLVNSLECRQTGASWSFEYIDENSISKVIEGTEKSIKSKIPEKELLIAIKIHSGRFTDVRDIVSLGKDIEIDKIREHIDRGEQEKLIKILIQIKEKLKSPGFIDSFKGVFSEKKFPEEKVNTIEDLIDDLILLYG